MAGQAGHGGRVGQNHGVGPGGLQQNGLHLLHRGVVAGGVGLHEQPGGVGGVVHHGGAGQAAVGQGDHLIVRRGEEGVEHGHGLHRALLPVGLDVVAHLEGLEDQQHQAAGKVAQRTLKGKAHGHTAAGQQGQKAGGLNAQNAGHVQAQQHIQHNAGAAGQKRVQAGVQLIQCAAVLHQADHPAAEPQADHQHHQGAEQLCAQVGAVLDQLIGEGFQRIHERFRPFQNQNCRPFPAGKRGRPVSIIASGRAAGKGSPWRRGKD